MRAMFVVVVVISDDDGEMFAFLLFGYCLLV